MGKPAAVAHTNVNSSRAGTRALSVNCVPAEVVEGTPLCLSGGERVAVGDVGSCEGRSGVGGHVRREGQRRQGQLVLDAHDCFSEGFERLVFGQGRTTAASGNLSCAM